jgi:hypothetical protein
VGGNRRPARMLALGANTILAVKEAALAGEIEENETNRDIPAPDLWEAIEKLLAGRLPRPLRVRAPSTCLVA